eukprot:scaffold5383_cov222-Amphora_coffeaeformis.AAC.5
MMTGVLVIAFPVSVFSDLWSKELKRTGAFSTLDDDDDNDDGRGHQGDEKRGSLNPSQKLEAGLDQLSPVKQGSVRWADEPDHYVELNQSVNQSVESLSGELPGIKRTRSTSSLKGHQVAIDREDMINLLAQVQAMQESQREIKSILRKYRLQLQQVSSSSSHD